MQNDEKNDKPGVYSVEIKSLFQPLYSVQKKKYTGVEALSRGKYNEEILDAGQLFSLPANEQEELYLDRQCIESALTAFSQLADVEDISVFINFNSSLIDCPDIISGNILQIVKKAGLDPSQVVIELIESKVNDFSRLLEFVNLYRSKGFLIALDDVGSGFSNFDRIVHIQPDILKINKDLVNGIANDFYQQSVCKSLIELSHNIGCLALAEGVETLEDALIFQEFGVDMIQGFYFSKPSAQFSMNSGSAEIHKLIASWQKFADLRDLGNKQFLSRVKREAVSIVELLEESDKNNWNSILRTRVDDYQFTQCLYILDDSGIQVSETAVSSDSFHKEHLLFRPARKGTDHSLKSYFIKRQEKQKWFISDSYISNATGDICRTINLHFEYKEDVYFLCLDISLEIQNPSDILKRNLTTIV